MHGAVWDYLEACSDSDGWLFFQMTLFPAMATPEDVAAVEEWDSIYLENRGLTIARMGPDVVLVRDGFPIAGCSVDYYESVRDWMAEPPECDMILSPFERSLLRR